MEQKRRSTRSTALRSTFAGGATLNGRATPPLERFPNMPRVMGIDTAPARLYERASLTANGVPAWSL